MSTDPHIAESHAGLDDKDCYACQVRRGEIPSIAEHIAAVDAAREDLAAKVTKLEAELETARYVARKNREHFNTVADAADKLDADLARVTAERDQARRQLKEFLDGAAGRSNATDHYAGGGM